ncbi:MAG: UvrD-helicase domain-containing protein, partial [Bacteroidales bacterium]|nr:UvrD-helicase domain-containing protein [Bacteroidales bacterium]
RITCILAKGGDPSRVLALTFTKKAATEMKERIARMVGGRMAWKLHMGTFHSVFVKFLREYAGLLGYPSTFTIYDQSDSTSAIKACIKELGLDDKVYKPRDILSRISLAKNNLVTANAYRNNVQAVQKDIASRKPRICDIYSLYVEKCRNSGVMDFDDILLNMNILLRDFPQVLEAISSRFDHILVDEYQDTNFAQYVILKKLASAHRNICVVGDDSQSIYAFRGAKIENILNFKKDYPDCKIFRLEKNYRSTANIVDAANSLIAKNEGRIPKNCVSVGGAGDKIRLMKSFSEQEEALMICSEIISRMRTDHARYQDFAILYRTNSQSRALEEALRKRNLPYVIFSGNSFFDRAEVKDMMAYLKLVVNVNDDESFKRVVNMPARGIGDTSLNALAAMARQKGLSMFKAAYSTDFADYGLKAPAVARIRAFCDMISDLASKVPVTNAHELSRAVADASGLYAHFKADNSIEGQSRASNVEELVNSATQFVEERQDEYLQELMADSEIDDESQVDYPVVTVGDFLENISLLSNVDMESDEDTMNKIALMTVHSAKGLEFPYVIVAGLEENLFPSGGMLASPSDIEEERRLMYVAMTRAKTALYLSFASTRLRNGKHESNAPSRFIKEITPKYLANPLVEDDFSEAAEDDLSGGFGRSFRGFGGFGGRNSGQVKFFPGQRPAPSAVRPSQAPSARKPGPVQTGPITRESLLNRPLPPKIPDDQFTPVPMTDLKVGQRIEHNRFGFGKILEITGQVPDLKAKIVFENYGEKILLLKYAKIRLG